MSLNWKQQLLGELLRASDNISRQLRIWVGRWGLAERIMTNKVITSPLLQSHQPDGFKERYPKPIATLVDGTVIAIDTARAVTLQQRATYNNKCSTNAAQAIAWVSPCGLGLIATSLFGGRLSEEACVWLHHLLLIHFPAGWARLVDRGFTHTTGAYLHFLQAFYPAFVKNGEIEAGVAADAQKQSSDRYVVEIYYSRVKRWSMLQDTARWSTCSMLDHAWHIAASNTDCYGFLRAPNNLAQTDARMSAMSSTLRAAVTQHVAEWPVGCGEIPAYLQSTQH